MNLCDDVLEYYSKPKATLSATYDELSSSGYDLGFRSRIVNGEDTHEITRDVVISVQSFYSNSLLNLVFANGMPIFLEFKDSSIQEYRCDYVELRYVLWGELRMVIEGQPVSFHQDDVSIVDPRVVRRELIEASNCALLNVNVRHDVFYSALLHGLSLSPLQQFLRTSILEARRKMHYIKFSPTNEEGKCHAQEHFWTIFKEATDLQPGYLDICKGHMTRLTNGLMQEWRSNLPERGGDSYRQKLYEAVTEYMEEHLSEVTMESLASEFNYQPSYFNRLIKRYAGVTYSKLLIQMRVSRAKRLLESTSLSVEEIMWLVGYHNKTFFYRQFSQAVGSSPAAYRRALHKGNDDTPTPGERHN